MKTLFIAALCLGLLACYAEAKKVFAHFMVGNTAHYDQSTWETEMGLAQGSRIDAFALNIAAGETMNDKQIPLAFAAAKARGFQLLFSFDYAGGREGGWTPAEVLALLRTHGTQGTYVKHNNLPLVSTFEGPDRANDWNDIKRQFNCFFVPDWSSKGAAVAIGLGGGVADGLFNWAAWPDRGSKDTYVDASYKVALKGKPYMMPVSPWFYTNLPGYDKNWLWRGETLWYERWVQALHVQPEWIQIISWNDYGESHYIAPIRGEASLLALDDKHGQAPINYVSGIEHGAWRAFLPYLIELYRSGTASVSQEGLNVWYRLQPRSAGCNDGGTTAFTATHMQPEGPWYTGLTDGVFFAALLGSTATAEVTVGGQVFKPTWHYIPEGGVGVYFGYVHTQATGSVRVEIKRNGGTVVGLTGDKPIAGCQDGYFNFNPAVYGVMGPSISPRSPPMKIDKDTPCIKGTGIGDFQELCENACNFNYCPIEACMCTQWGKDRGVGLVRGPPGYPAAGRDSNFEGLCAVTCSYGIVGVCPANKCGKVKLPTIISKVSPFTAPSCTSGRAVVTVPGDQKALDQICAFGCKHGYCPTALCTCDSIGTLLLPEPTTFTGEKPGFRSVRVAARLLCRYTCGWGVCPAPVCKYPPAPPPPQACVEGSGTGQFSEVCKFACKYNFCPSPCTCTKKGDAVSPPSAVAIEGFPLRNVADNGLCAFSCKNGFCPATSCYNLGSGPGGIFYELPPPKGSAQDICQAFDDAQTSQQAWAVSRAGIVLDNIVSARGPIELDDHLSNLTKVSVKNCENVIDVVSCLTPQFCPQNPDMVALRYIQTAFANFHSFLAQWRSSLGFSGLLASVSVSSIVNSISMKLVNDVAGMEDALAAIGGAFGVAGAVAGPVSPGGSAFLSAVGGLVGIASTLEKTKEIEGEWARNATEALNTRLGIILNAMNTAFDEMGKAVMSHGDLSKMTRSALAYDASKGTIRTDIAKFFADGKFARPVKDFSAFANELTKVLKTSMVSTALLSANVYVLRNAHTRNNCEKNNGRMLKIDTADELCYTLEWPGKGRKGLHWNQIPERNDLTQIVDKDMLDNVVAKVYEASAEEIIHGSVYCQAKTGEYNGAQELEPTEAVPGGGKWPKCFWNLPVFTLDPKDILTTTPCRIYFDNPDNKKVGDLGKGFLPDHLAQVFNKDFCEPADCGIPGCEGNKRRSARDFTF